MHTQLPDAERQQLRHVILVSHLKRKIFRGYSFFSGGREGSVLRPKCSFKQFIYPDH